MKRKSYQVAFPASLVVVLVAFLSIIFLANANPSFAASAKKKAPAVAKTTAVEHTEARIKELQGALKITEDQEPLWSNLTLVMRDNAKNMDALTKDRHEATKTMNAVDRMKFHSQITEARLDQLKKFIPPFEALYASLSDEQKKITDAIFQTGRHGKHKIK
ncbi:MAG: Spy/CpxP family protein refolding chaperone [Desulfuromonadales bacterium]|nr:Spy/CpxP family protein refolding chaperone [Desulfuromonadales bacterium]